ncbi:MAG: YggT family protein [bacterium]|jgi:YggT family protein
MLFQIVSLLLEVTAGVLAGACLLRLYMQHQRIPMSVRSGNPLGRFVFALTDWIVLPLRRLVPAAGRWDLASLAAAYLIVLAQFSVLWSLLAFADSYVSVLILAAFGVVKIVISGLTGLVIVYAVLSWVQSKNVLADVIDRLVAPVLAPIRRLLPLVGGIDLSPLVLLVLLQVLLIVLGEAQGWALL